MLFSRFLYSIECIRSGVSCIYAVICMWGCSYSFYKLINLLTLPPQNILILINKSHTKMNRLFRKTIVALLAIVWSASSLQAQEVNMSRYITLTVKQGTTVHFDIWADAPNTP